MLLPLRSQTRHHAPFGFGSGGYKDSQGKTGSTGSKGAQDELKVEKEKNENSLPEKELRPQEVNH